MRELILSLGAQDYIALAAVTAAAIIAFLYMKKRGGKGCAGCPYSGECDKKECENGTENKLPTGTGEDNKKP